MERLPSYFMGCYDTFTCVDTAKILLWFVRMDLHRTLHEVPMAQDV